MHKELKSPSANTPFHRLRIFLARSIGRIPFDFRGKHTLISLLWNERSKPVIREILPLSIGKRLIQAQSDSHIGWHIFVYGTYERNLVSRMLQLTKGRDNRLAIDIGANIGQYSLICSSIFKQVYAFEPVPYFGDRLCENLKLNQISNVKLFRQCLGSEPGVKKMVVVEYQDVPQTASVDRGKGVVNQDWSSVDVEQTTLDLIVSPDQRVDYIKIDTDGTEYEILRGASRTLADNDAIIQIELIDGIKQWRGKESLMDTVNLLESFSYRLLNSNGKTAKPPYIGNYFAVKNP